MDTVREHKSKVRKNCERVGTFHNEKTTFEASLGHTYLGIGQALAMLGGGIGEPPPPKCRPNKFRPNRTPSAIPRRNFLDRLRHSVRLIWLKKIMIRIS